MNRFVVLLLLSAMYGGILALLVQLLGQPGILVWLLLVIAIQFWLRQRARNY